MLGPQITSWSTQRANRKQFNRDQNAKRRDDLRAVLDEAALLLASGATNLRLIGANQVARPPRFCRNSLIGGVKFSLWVNDYVFGFLKIMKLCELMMMPGKL